MQTNAPVSGELVLLGGGHAQVAVLDKHLAWCHCLCTVTMISSLYASDRRYLSINPRIHTTSQLWLLGALFVGDELGLSIVKESMHI